MAIYTSNPIPLYEARQINSQADGDAWVASLTPNELVSPDATISNVRIEIVDSTVWLKYTRSSEIGADDYAIDTELGGYAIANKYNGGINLWVEGAENFDRRYQPYAQPPA